MISQESATLKQIAFVAMPFRVKETGLEPGKGPHTVDFDALWNLAYYPALEKLGYLPIRADNQDGSLIIKDMLEQLVFADLVLVDISIPNGNVYYEAGIRHAARAEGCVLISADWSQPLFDLAQIRKILYPLQNDCPIQADYDAIRDILITTLPELARGEGPVYSLISKESLKQGDSRMLRESADILAGFQMDVRACHLADDDTLPAMIDSLGSKYLEDGIKLPLFAVRELLELYRDKMGWQTVLEMETRFDENTHRDPFIIEQVALARCKLGDPRKAIVELEQLIESHGKTPERLGLLGGRCKELYKNSKNKLEKQKWLARAIGYYESGMLLDLNEYYCACTLLALLRERNGPGDWDRARQIAHLVLLACQRKEIQGVPDDWLILTRLTTMFFLEDIPAIQAIIRLLLTLEIPSWKITTAVTDIKDILDNMVEDKKEKFENILDDLILHICISQEKLLSVLGPIIMEKGKIYKKKLIIHARPAITGEMIVSYTSDGRETKNTANTGDFVVENQTAAKEQYIVSKEAFEKRYELLDAIDGQWSRYTPLGRIRGITVDDAVMRTLKQFGTFYIFAPWNEPQKVERNDLLVSTLPDLNEIYRIARQEFEETYQANDTPT